MTEEFDNIRDADGCEDHESLEESGLNEAESAEDVTVEDAVDEAEDAAAAALAEAKDKYMRLFAEFDNYRKRTAREKAETYQDAVSKTIQELLPAIDSFGRAMDAPCTDEAYKSGMEKIYQQLDSLLKKLGIEEIPALNEPFDPKVHNAIRQVDDENFAENTVCEVYQKGYKLGDRIVRCAMVAVAN